MPIDDDQLIRICRHCRKPHHLSKVRCECGELLTDAPVVSIATLREAITSRKAEEAQEAAKLRPTDDSVTPVPAGAPRGVGGWLALLVFWFILVLPAGVALMTSESWRSALVGSVPWMENPRTHFYALTAAALSLVAGLGLLRGRRWASVELARVILWITGPIAAGMLLPEVAADPSTPVATEWLIAIWLGTVAWSSIWTAYLHRSRRVANTYGNGRSRE